MRNTKVLLAFVTIAILSSTGVTCQAKLAQSPSVSSSSWSRTYGGARYDIGQSVIPVSSGGFLVAGYTCSFALNLADLWLVRIDEAGQLLWHQNYGYYWDGVHDVDEYSGWTGAIGWFAAVECQDGGFAVGGQTWEYADERINDAWIIRVDAEGTQLWNYSYGAENEDWGNDLIELEDGGFLIVGFYRSAPFYVG